MGKKFLLNIVPLFLYLLVSGGFLLQSANARETGGLAAHFYNERDLDKDRKVKIVHEGVEIPNAVYTKENPPPHGRNIFFSVRWLGSIQAPKSGEYQFQVEADDGARLVLDGELLADSWFTQAGDVKTGEPVTLQEGSWTDILLEYRQMLGDGAIHLRWKTPGAEEFTVVPGEHLSPEPPSSPWRVTGIRFRPASGQATAMKGGRFTGSNMSATNGFEEIAAVTGEVGEGWNEIAVEDAQLYRWIKWEGPQGSHGQVAELRFLHENQPLTGEAFGTAGPGTEPWSAAFDDNPQTAYKGDDPEKAFIVKPGHWTGSWDEEMEMYLRYYEILHAQMKAKHPDWPIAVIPVGVGLMKLRDAVEAGDYPGLPAGSDYFQNFHMDSLHQSYSGGYFAALIHFAALYGVDPTGKVTSATTGLTPEQAEFLQKLAWETVQQYPLSPLNILK